MDNNYLAREAKILIKANQILINAEILAPMVLELQNQPNQDRKLEILKIMQGILWR